MNHAKQIGMLSLMLVLTAMFMVAPRAFALTIRWSQNAGAYESKSPASRPDDMLSVVAISPADLPLVALPQKRTQPQGGPLIRTDLIGGNGNSVQIAVQIEDISNLGAFDIDVVALGDVIRLQGGTLGDFLSITGRTVYTLGFQTSEDGTTFPAAAYTTGNQLGVDGSGTLVTLDASVEAEGMGYLVFSRALFGTPTGEPIVVSREVDALHVQPIYEGWNLVALCPDVSGQPVSDVFQTITGNYDALRDANGQMPTALAGGQGVWVRGTNNAPTRLTILGMAREATTALALTPGWHLVAYCGEASITLTEALASIDGRYDRVIGLTGAYDTNLGEAYQTLMVVRPGDVLLIHMTECSMAILR